MSAQTRSVQGFAVPQIELAGVSKKYERLIIDNLNLTVAKGEFLTIIGPSGCGKSTVLKLISGLTFATSGDILVDGMTPKNARETMSFTDCFEPLSPMSASIECSLKRSSF